MTVKFSVICNKALELVGEYATCITVAKQFVAEGMKVSIHRATQAELDSVARVDCEQYDVDLIPADCMMEALDIPAGAKVYPYQMPMNMTVRVM